MAGKSNRGRSRKGPNNASNSSNFSEPLVLSEVPGNDNTVGTSEPTKADVADITIGDESTSVNSDMKEHETLNSGNQIKQGESV